jgi:hypothetical protein
MRLRTGGSILSGSRCLEGDGFDMMVKSRVRGGRMVRKATRVGDVTAADRLKRSSSIGGWIVSTARERRVGSTCGSSRAGG